MQREDRALARISGYYTSIELGAIGSSSYDYIQTTIDFCWFVTVSQFGFYSILHLVVLIKCRIEEKY
jgi:hypothetical protein